MNTTANEPPKTHRQGRHFWRNAIIIVIIVLTLAYGWAVLFLFRHLNNASSRNDNTTIYDYSRNGASYSVEAADRPSLGDTSADMVIVEFARYQCETCQTKSEMIRQAVSLYDGRIRYIVRDYPAQDDEWSGRLSEAAACAGDQGKFWIMHDRMMGTPSIPDQTKLNGIAVGAGLEMAQFDSCFSGRKYQDQIRQDLADAQTFGVTTAPTMIINGRILSHPVTEEIFYNIIDSIYPSLTTLHQNINQTEEENPVSST
ncbi:MAG: thioredoxin domain-containing protein [Patescibacteria group bacterium]|jgi:protein-disulfide isomerase